MAGLKSMVRRLPHMSRYTLADMVGLLDGKMMSPRAILS